MSSTATPWNNFRSMTSPSKPTLMVCGVGTPSFNGKYRDGFGVYTLEQYGPNAKGNYFCVHRYGPYYANRYESYHYVNNDDGSSYYRNPDGSIYHMNKYGVPKYTPPPLRESEYERKMYASKKPYGAKKWKATKY